MNEDKDLNIHAGLRESATFDRFTMAEIRPGSGNRYL